MTTTLGVSERKRANGEFEWKRPLISSRPDIFWIRANPGGGDWHSNFSQICPLKTPALLVDESVQGLQLLTRQGETFDHFWSSLIAHVFDLSVWQEVQGFGILTRPVRLTPMVFGEQLRCSPQKSNEF